jgi:hypothetical protein
MKTNKKQVLFFGKIIYFRARLCLSKPSKQLFSMLLLPINFLVSIFFPKFGFTFGFYVVFGRIIVQFFYKL